MTLIKPYPGASARTTLDLALSQLGDGGMRHLPTQAAEVGPDLGTLGCSDFGTVAASKKTAENLEVLEDFVSILIRFVVDFEPPNLLMDRFRLMFSGFRDFECWENVDSDFVVGIGD